MACKPGPAKPPGSLKAAHLIKPQVNIESVGWAGRRSAFQEPPVCCCAQQRPPHHPVSRPPCPGRNQAHGFTLAHGLQAAARHGDGFAPATMNRYIVPCGLAQDSLACCHSPDGASHSTHEPTARSLTYITSLEGGTSFRRLWGHGHGHGWYPQSPVLDEEDPTQPCRRFP